jgi:hypothetical protein
MLEQAQRLIRRRWPDIASPDEADALKGQLLLYQGRRPYRQTNP